MSSLAYITVNIFLSGFHPCILNFILIRMCIKNIHLCTNKK